LAADLASDLAADSAADLAQPGDAARSLSARAPLHARTRTEDPRQTIRRNGSRRSRSCAASPRNRHRRVASVHSQRRDSTLPPRALARGWEGWGGGPDRVDPRQVNLAPRLITRSQARDHAEGSEQEQVLPPWPTLLRRRFLTEERRPNAAFGALRATLPYRHKGPRKFDKRGGNLVLRQ
jgi:hypothetical protein